MPSATRRNYRSTTFFTCTSPAHRLRVALFGRRLQHAHGNEIRGAERIRDDGHHHGIGLEGHRSRPQVVLRQLHGVVANGGLPKGVAGIRNQSARRVLLRKTNGAAREGCVPRRVRRRKSLLFASDEDNHQRALTLRRFRGADDVGLTDAQVQRGLQQGRQLIALLLGKMKVADLQ